MSAALEARISALVRADERSEEEREVLARLLALFAGRSAAPDPEGVFPAQERLRERFLQSLEGDSWEAVEAAFLELYCHLHMHAAPYTPEERRRVDESGGYWCHAGGLSPLLRAGPWIGPETVLADFGAGNGLQGLLLQALHPHRRTVLIEISSRMAAIGAGLRAWLDIAPERVEWVVDDVRNCSPAGIDFIYLYRPLRPEGVGRSFYERFAAELEREQRPVVIFSIADCLREFLPASFQVIYGDGHLTCYRRP